MLTCDNNIVFSCVPNTIKILVFSKDNETPRYTGFVQKYP